MMGGAAAAIGLVAGVAGSVLQAKAAVQQGNAAYSAGMTNARNATQEGNAEERRRRTIARQELATEQVSYAKAGVALEGSPLEVLAQNAAALDRSALDARLAGFREASLYRQQAKTALKVSRQQALSSILSGVSGGLATGYKIGGG